MDESVGKLGDGENAFAVEFLAVLLIHTGQQTKIVFLDRFLPAPGLEFAFGAMPVQDEIGWGWLESSAAILSSRFRTSPARVEVFTFSVDWLSP